MINKQISLKSIKKYKSSDEKVFYKSDLESTSDYYSNVFNKMEEGISVLDGNYVIEDVNFAMQKWYGHRDRIVGEKCYKVYHNRKQPCEVCPVRKTLETGKSYKEIVPYQTFDNDAAGWQEVRGYPVYDGGEIVGVIEYIKDVTYEMDLFSKVASIERELVNLKTQNEVLNEYLSQKEQERSALENNISLNVKKLVKPVIHELQENYGANQAGKQMMTFLESLLEKIVEPYMNNAVNSICDFTTREIEIMQLIKQGKSSKEIASMLFVTEKTVAFHRGNIRKKLELKKTDNLRAYLLKKPIVLE